MYAMGLFYSSGVPINTYGAADVPGHYKRTSEYREVVIRPQCEHDKPKREDQRNAQSWSPLIY